MKLNIHNASTLNLINPDDIAEYLSKTGWNEKKRIEKHYSIWDFQDDENEDKNIILLPFDKSYIDYLLRIADILKILGKKEKREQIEIFRDILIISADVIKIPLETDGNAEGSISLDKGAEAIQQAKEIMISAACATEEPKPFFPPKKTNTVLRYIENIKLGQSEQGSYVVPIITHLPQRDEQTTLNPINPFEREVGLKLVCALESMKSAANEYLETKKIECFEKTIQKGVSANLCEAVTKISSINENREDLIINFSWSEKIPIIENKSTQVTLPYSIMGTLEKAAEYLRQFIPIENFKLYGQVIRLEKKTQLGSGTVTVESNIEGQLHKISFELPESEYHMAVRAHDRYRNIALKGTLIKEGKFFKLINPTNLKVEWEL